MAAATTVTVRRDAKVERRWLCFCAALSEVYSQTLQRLTSTLNRLYWESLVLSAQQHTCSPADTTSRPLARPRQVLRFPEVNPPGRRIT
ncbi:hypothetical protein E2C01_021248 [Portunus trituberculatus]|uniref:Uncharacterized protein n=1 Tax=Portunus trituberculatus TaxID=210409 RepID=A0A5B7E3V9_PORTR|nr:hypothetical protein [Portunus trituberculatus]